MLYIFKITNQKPEKLQNMAVLFSYGISVTYTLFINYLRLDLIFRNFL